MPSLTSNRWVVITAGFLLNLMIGINLAWSVFVRPFMDSFGWTKTMAALPFTIYIIAVSLTGIPAGQAQDRLGPRKVAIVGSIIFGSGFILASLIGVIRNPLWLYLVFAPLGGIGAGIAYTCTMPPARKWFPDRPGLALGFVVGGLGLSALLFAPLARYLIDSQGVPLTFLIVGTIILIVSIFAASLLRNPPPGWQPEKKGGGKRTQPAKAMAGKDCKPTEVVRSARLWLLWLMFAFTSAAGLLVIGHIAAYSQEVGLTPMTAATAAGVIAVFNGLGRPGSGIIADKIGVLKTMLILFTVQGIVMVVFTRFAVTMTTIYFAGSIVGFIFGSVFTLFPVITADFFGLKNFGVNYGILFTAFGAGATLGPVMGSYFYDTTHSYDHAFFIAGLLTFLAVVFTLLLVRSRSRAALTHLEKSDMSGKEL